MTITIEITSKVQEAMDTIMNGGYECAEWCWVPHAHEHLGKFGKKSWTVDADEEVKFLKDFIKGILEANHEVDVEDYDDMIEFADDAANIRAAATLLWEIDQAVLCKLEDEE